MKSVQIACLAAVLAVGFVAQPLAASAQGILNQSGDQLLKDFNVDPSQLPPQYAQSAPAPATGTPQSYPAPAQSQFLPSQSGGGGAKSTLLRVLSGAIPKVDVDNAGGVRVKAPFVNVNVGNGQHDVRVSAPFVNYNTGQGANVHVPGILNVNPQSGAPQGVPNTAPQGTPYAPGSPYTAPDPQNAAPQGIPYTAPQSSQCTAPQMVPDGAASPMPRIPQVLPSASFGAK